MKIRHIAPGVLACASLATLLVIGASARGQEPAGTDKERATPVSVVGERLEQVGPNRFRVVPKDTPYDRWLEKNKTKMPYFAGLLIQDGRTEPLKPWPEMGKDVKGLYIRMADYQITDGWLIEIPPRGSTALMKHMYEAGLYFFGGPGHTMVQQEGKAATRVDWKKRSLFSVPLNAKYQHFNDSDQPVRFLAVTSFPYVINAMDSARFINENTFAFDDRYNGEQEFATKSTRAATRVTVTNLVPDALDFKLEKWEARGKGSTNMNWEMAGNTMLSMHVSEMPAGEYKRAHRHSSDAFILLLSGKGYSLTWPEGAYDKRIRVNWTEGTIFVPPIYWYHQHLNPDGKESARYLAINAPSIVSRLGLRFEDQLEPDLPQIEQEFKAEVAKRQNAGTQQ